MPWMRSRARRMSASGGAQACSGSELPERRDRADALGGSALHDVMRGGEVFDRDAERLEERDLAGGGPARHAAQQQVAQLAHDVVLVDRALRIGISTSPDSASADSRRST